MNLFIFKIKHSKKNSDFALMMQSLELLLET